MKPIQRIPSPQFLLAAGALALLGASTHAAAQDPSPSERGAQLRQEAQRLEVVRGGGALGKRTRELEVVALFERQMPTGVTLSRDGRLFVCFPRWGDAVEFTVAEIVQGRQVPFPDAEVNRFDAQDVELAAERLVCVQSVVVDAKDRLWLLDAGSLELGPTIRNAPKLWAYDLSSHARVHAITFPNDVVLKKTYLNDVRFDLERGAAGTAYITDSGAGGIVVIDLASGASWRHLDGHPSVMPAVGLQPTTEGEPFLQRTESGEQRVPDIRSDGIALSPDGSTLYYTPLISREVYAVPTELLADRASDPATLAAAVRRIATKPSANDGLICDGEGRIYTTDWEDGAIRRIDPRTGAVELLAQDERMLWPDTLALHGSHLYVLSNQLARQPRFHFGRDLRKPPHALFRLPLERTLEAGSR